MADMYSKEEFERRKRKGSLTPLPEVPDEDEVELPATLPTKLTAPTPAEKAAVVEPPEKTAVENKIAGNLGLPKLEVPKTAAEPAAPKLMQAKSPDWNKFSKAYDGIAKRFAEDRKLSPEVEQAFSARQAELQSALSDAKGIYESAVSTAKSEADRREAITQWASIAESLGQSMVKYFAAREGARTGTLLGSKLQFQKYDWQKDLDRSLEKLKADTSEAKTRLGLAREDVEAQAKQLGEERKTAVAEREDIARQRAKSAESLLSEQTRAEQRSAEQYASDYNRFLMEQEQEKGREARAEAKEQKAATKKESEVDLAKQKTFAQLAGAVASLEKKDTPQARKQIEETATLLGIPPDEVDELVKETTGEGMFQMAEPKKVQAILDKYRPSAAPAAAQTSGQPTTQAATVTVKDKTTGQTQTVPRNYLDTPAAKEALAKGTLVIVGQ